MAVNPIQKTVEPIDHEWHGNINKAAGQGGLFSLLLAMLDADPTHRPYIEKSDDKEPEQQGLTNYYRRPALEVHQNDWQCANIIRELLASDMQNSRLFQTMHPQPLATENDPIKIAPEVKANCSFVTQNRMRKDHNRAVKQDPTMLFDVLESMQKEPVII